MNVGDLTLERFARDLAAGGISVRSGPFVARILSELPELAAPLHELYRDFPLQAEGLVDYHVSIRKSGRWWRGPSSLAAFHFDGEQPFRAFERRAALAFLEWGLNRCIYVGAHQFLIFHAAVVDRDGKALVLPGAPGSGKSTLCAALIHRGWRLLSDELTLVRPADGKLSAIARPVSLKDESIGIIRRFAPAAVLGPVLEDTHKGDTAHMRPPAESVRRADELSRPAWIVFPRYTAGAEARLAPLPKARAFFRLADNSFNYDKLGATGFRLTCDMVDASDCYEFAFSELDEAVGVLDSL